MDLAMTGRPHPVVVAVAAAAAVVVFAILRAAGVTTGVAVAVAAVGLLLALAAVAVARTRREQDRALRAESDAEAERERHRSVEAQLQKEVRHLEHAVSQERLLIRRVRESLRAEREWSRELREQLHDLHATRARESERVGTVPELILTASVKLLEADRGLLLTRDDVDGDGDLDLVASLGFRHDPEHSAVAQRFAREVLERDEIIRENEPARPPDGGQPADEEIDSLVAIPLYLRHRFHGVIVCVNRPGGFEELGDEVLLALGDHAGAALHHGRLHHEVREAQRSTVRVLAEAVASHDPVLHRESGRLAVLGGRVAERLGMSEEDTDVLVCATVLRAVGYLPLPEQPLRRRGVLGSEERALIEMHPRLAFNILAQSPALREVGVTLLYHHERVDGRGYPAGLVAENIPLAARVLAVLEAYGAMTHERPYRSTVSSEEACDELVRHAGTQFDADVVRVFVDVAASREPEDEDATLRSALDSLPFDAAQEDGGAMSRLAASGVDGMTMLGNHRALVDAVRQAAAEPDGESFAVAMAQIEDLADVNARFGYLAGDRLVQVAARAAQRAAVRVGGTAYRDSGRRLSIIAPLHQDVDLADLVHELRTEFAGGPAVRIVASPWEPGESGEDVVTRAREALKTMPDPS